MHSLKIGDLGQALFGEAGDALFLFDPATDAIVDINPTAQRLSGFGREELIGTSTASLIRTEERKDLSRLKAAAQVTGVFHGQEGYLLRTRQQDVWIPVNLTITRLHLQDRTLGLITARDIREQRAAYTKLKTMESELRRVLSSVSDCLWSARTDESGRWIYRYFSPVVERITGRAPAFFMQGRDRWPTVVHPDDRSAWEGTVASWLSAQSSQEEYRVVRPDGDIRWVRESVVASAAAEGKALFLDGILTDVTDRKRTDQE